MSEAIRGLEPAGVWKYFAEISLIPRGSKNETAVAAYVLEKAKEFGCEAVRDGVGNVLVRKPASPGREGTAGIVLQGHLDMVCEKNADKEHDFLKDPIELVREGNVLRANGTTLGADNGIAVATNLAIMADRNLEHGPLELLFTIDEETGLTGASQMAPDLLTHRTLLNLDSEEEGSLYVGCSGGRDTSGLWELETRPAPASSVVCELTVKGLRGGHSGLEIDKGRGNAIRVLGRALLALTDLEVRVAGIDGGNKRNAIPRECVAVVTLPKKNVEKAKGIVGELACQVAGEFASVDPDVRIELTESRGKKKVKVMKKSLQRAVTRTLMALPHGVMKMSPDIPGLVETSTNLAVITTTKKDVRIATSQRSSVASELDEIQQGVSAVFGLAGAAVTDSDGYPGWKPNLDSPVLALTKRTYRDLYGRDPEIKAIHAGLECGIIGEKYPGMDMVSFGPTLEGVHSPDEKIHVDTVGKFYDLVLALLRNAS